ncbi:MAG: riboflavin kinase [Patescibacteria group bacterium]
MTEGKVLKGDKSATKLGFPTANINNKDNVLPGIYAGRVVLGKEILDAVLYVGKKRKEILEAHILDFKKNIYGKTIKVEVLEKIRDDEEFSDIGLLKEKIEKDTMDAWAILFGHK